MFYQTLLHELAPDLNPAGVEATMRLQYNTLDHLPRETFAEEAKLAAEMERQSPGTLRRIAESMGMADDFAKWEATARPAARDPVYGNPDGSGDEWAATLETARWMAGQVGFCRRSVGDAAWNSHKAMVATVNMILRHMGYQDWCAKEVVEDAANSAHRRITADGNPAHITAA